MAKRSRKKTAGQIRAEMKQYASQIQTAIYDLVRCAVDLLGDPQYVDQFGGEDKLMEDFQAKEFAHFGGSPSVGQLIKAFRSNPSREVWEEYHYNVWAMIELAKPSKEPADKDKISWKSLAKELQAKVATLEAAIEEYRTVNTELREKCEKLATENGVLTGRLAELRDRRGAA